ncbi:MAG: hypothetical protein H7Y38_10755 [Armatimonadetes bacterium]|nr:hypothetical protein [Armatimonadota bacterium]
MDDLTRKRQFVRELANKLFAAGKTIDATELAIRLNAAGHMTGYGTEFAGERGTYMLIRGVYYWLDKVINSHDESTAVARAFTKPDGRYAYGV